MESTIWTFQSRELHQGRVLQYFIELNGEPAAFEDVLQGWKADPDFRSRFNHILAQAPFSSFRWETPPVSLETTSRAFEFVLLDSPLLDRKPAPGAFSEHFQQSPEQDVLVFPNLGGDAVLIVPHLISKVSAYSHLAAFVRNAPETQRHHLWQQVSKAMIQRLGNGSPVWLSTAGGGVSWLHVRLDDRPKYYGFGPYRQLN